MNQHRHELIEKTLWVECRIYSKNAQLTRCFGWIWNKSTKKMWASCLRQLLELPISIWSLKWANAFFSLSLSRTTDWRQPGTSRGEKNSPVLLLIVVIIRVLVQLLAIDEKCIRNIATDRRAYADLISWKHRAWFFQKDDPSKKYDGLQLRMSPSDNGKWTNNDNLSGYTQN